MNVRVAAIQSSFSDNVRENVARMDEWVRVAAEQGAQIILMPELFEGHYFPQSQNEENFERARPAENHATICHFQNLARALKVVLPVSFFEKTGPDFYNSVAVIDADGKILGTYRKSHIPDGPGYCEKFYFRPGNTGFKVWKTAYGAIGVGICWDQWFPETARCMTLMGADLLFYPTAIGSEPAEPELDTKDPWQRAMVGHAVSNVVGVIAANRIGDEKDISFYGHSFIVNSRGDLIAEMTETEQGVIHANFDLDQVRRDRRSYGFFRDRRPDLYNPITE